ncbi:MAG: hypothetical protein WA021_00660 [Minisyncoccia bacterium]
MLIAIVMAATAFTLLGSIPSADESEARRGRGGGGHHASRNARAHRSLRPHRYQRARQGQARHKAGRYAASTSKQHRPKGKQKNAQKHGDDHGKKSNDRRPDRKEKTARGDRDKRGDGEGKRARRERDGSGRDRDQGGGGSSSGSGGFDPNILLDALAIFRTLSDPSHACHTQACPYGDTQYDPAETKCGVDVDCIATYLERRDCGTAEPNPEPRPKVAAKAATKRMCRRR